MAFTGKSEGKVSLWSDVVDDSIDEHVGQIEGRHRCGSCVLMSRCCRKDVSILRVLQDDCVDGTMVALIVSRVWAVLR
jgi:hypothetical protein